MKKGFAIVEILTIIVATMLISATITDIKIENHEKNVKAESVSK